MVIQVKEREESVRTFPTGPNTFRMACVPTSLAWITRTYACMHARTHTLTLTHSLTHNTVLRFLASRASLVMGDGMFMYEEKF